MLVGRLGDRFGEGASPLFGSLMAFLVGCRLDICVRSEPAMLCVEVSSEGSSDEIE